MSRLYNILDKLTDRTLPESKTASITASTGELVGSYCYVIGNLCFLNIGVRRDVEVRQGYNIFAGSISTTELRPASTVSGCALNGTSALIGAFASDGSIRVAVFGDNVAANTQVWLTFIYRLNS